MKRVTLIAASCFIVAVALDAQDRPSSIVNRPDSVADGRSPIADGRSPIDDGRAVVQKYCVSCHNEKVKSGGLTLSTLDMARVTANADVWEHVIRKVRTGAMPPAGRPRPDKAMAENLVTYLETELDAAAYATPNPGRPALPRLNRA